MPKFVMTFHSGANPEEPSPDVMDRWMAWFGELGEAIVDMGAPFGASATVAADGSSSEGAGSDPATGYTVIQAADMDEAIAKASGCPGLSGTGSLKIFEAMDMG